MAGAASTGEAAASTELGVESSAVIDRRSPQIRIDQRESAAAFKAGGWIASNDIQCWFCVSIGRLDDSWYEVSRG